MANRKGDKLNGPVAIVTGGTRGIGKGISLALAESGYNVVVNHVSPAGDPVQVLKSEIESLGVSCVSIQANIGQKIDRDKLVTQTEAAFGRCDLLVNNAGVAPEKRVNILETTEESYDRVMDINLKGPFFLSQQVANWMIRQKKNQLQRPFRIINIGSISAYTSSPTRSEYCISKAGMGMMTRLFADYLAGEGIGVFEIRPGITETDMTTVAKEKYDKLIAEGLTPIKRWGKPQDIGQAVVAIVEGRLDFSPGQVIDVDGGFHLRRL
jgi:NAD(P)-dependent dehydrogenase (short-subunit alcohol dehydrogenase family)